MNDEPTTAPGEEETARVPADVSDEAADVSPREPAELIMAMSPRQILGGFALMAALILMLRRRMRGRD
ncbi:MAG: hypothetical protein ABIQ17_03340 [Candidatus Limnocylindrales bacterium]